MIAERGVCEARIADVAERIGISPALVLYYFPSKDALLVEALTHRDQQFFDAVAEASVGVERASDRLRMVIDASCPPEDGIAHDDNEWTLWLEMWSRSRHDPGLARTRSHLDAQFRAMIAGIVRSGIASGEFDAGVDPEWFSIMLTALVDGLAIQVLLRDDAVSLQTMREICVDTAFRALVNGK